MRVFLHTWWTAASSLGHMRRHGFEQYKSAILYSTNTSIHTTNQRNPRLKRQKTKFMNTARNTYARIRVCVCARVRACACVCVGRGVKGPAADATDAPQPWGLLCKPAMKISAISFFRVIEHHFVHHKSHMIGPGIEPGSPRWEDGD
jgi:hypothetical protein